MSTHEQLAALAKKFPASTIHQVPVGGGVKADYVPASVVIEKLLAVVGPFTWEVRETIGDGPTRAVVVGRLTLEIDGRTVSVDGIGEGADLKAAESDAVKRAGRMAGVGLHLWSQSDYRLDRALRADEVES